MDKSDDKEEKKEKKEADAGNPTIHQKYSVVDSIKIVFSMKRNIKNKSFYLKL